MDEEELRDAIENTGMTQYQASAYLALLELGAASAADIAEASGVPGPRIYDVLRDLENRGHVELYKQGSLHARIHDPSTILETFDQRVEQFKRAKESVEERWQQPDLQNYAVSIVKRRETAYERAAQAIEQANNQVKLCLDAQELGRFAEPLETAYENDVYVKLCLATEEEPTNGQEDFIGRCTEARHRYLPAPFLAIIDRETVCFAPQEHSRNQYGVIVHETTHAYVFNVFFKTSLWEQWEQIYQDDVARLGRVYVDIRQCVYDVESLIDGGASVWATVRGKSIENGESMTVSGKIAGTEFDAGPNLDERVKYPLMDGIASLAIETEDGTITAGGWGAMLEDIEATRVTIDRVENDPDP